MDYVNAHPNLTVDVGQVLFGALSQCVTDNMCADEACVIDNCGVELQACGV